jgi:hypothetical protein
MPEIIILERKIGAAHRRLFLQTLVNLLVWSLSAGLVLGCLWFLAEPFLVKDAPDWLRWAAAGAALGGSVVTALALAWRLCPTRLDAALTLDQRFGLKERAITSFMLSPEQRGSSAGQALMEDAGRSVASLHVGSRFPIRLRWSAAVVPLCAMMLAAIALFYDPSKGTAGDEKKNEESRFAAAEEEKQDKKLDDAMQKLESNPSKDPAEPADKDANANDIDREMGKIAHRPRETKEERERRWAELAKLEADIKKKTESERDKDDKIQEQLKKDEHDRLKKKNKDGPAKDLQDALDKGDTQKAQEEVDRLSKKLRNEELNKEDQQLLREQLQDMEKDLERLSRKKDEEKLLRELADKKEISQETLKQELDRINEEEQGEKKQDIEKLKKKLDEMAEKGQLDPDAAKEAKDKLDQDQKDLQDLKDAAEQLKQAEEAMADGDKEKAAQALQKAGDKLDGKEGQQRQQQMTQQLSRVQQAKQQMAKSAGQAGKGSNALSRKGSGSNSSQGGVGSGKRPEEKDDNFAFEHKKVDGEQDSRGANEITGYGPKPDKAKPRNPQEIAEEIKPRSQDAARAVGQQKTIRKDAADMTRGFFENLGDQKAEKK